ncbi:hypothetical protein [Micromonospora sp. RTP1Z1]|uniref:hypothetical protein n=1 Tax=Micromonospora sp. RTP1Z1 TaxID=2994043 RepID=UPI0029C7A93A|nr:hypothetical protein [Micromonospora sp. RTP1Z1]
MLGAVARRDNPGFFTWRNEMNRNDLAQQLLYPFLYEVFRLLVVRRFHDSDEVAEIRGFLAQPRLLLWPESGLCAPDAEALIRSALGASGLVGHLATGDIVVLRLQLMTYLVEDLKLSPTDLDALIAEAERFVLDSELPA